MGLIIITIPRRLQDVFSHVVELLLHVIYIDIDYIYNGMSTACETISHTLVPTLSCNYPLCYFSLLFEVPPVRGKCSVCLSLAYFS